MPKRRCLVSTHMIKNKFIFSSYIFPNIQIFFMMFRPLKYLDMKFIMNSVHWTHYEMLNFQLKNNIPVKSNDSTRFYFVFYLIWLRFWTYVAEIAQNTIPYVIKSQWPTKTMHCFQFIFWWPIFVKRLKLRMNIMHRKKLLQLCNMFGHLWYVEA